MPSILTVSGKHWVRAGMVWIAFGFGVHGLAQAGGDTDRASLSAHNLAVAHMVSIVAARNNDLGARQIAKVDVSKLDIVHLTPGEFGDLDETVSNLR